MFLDSFTDLARGNADFRRVLVTGQYCQIVAMSIPVRGDIGEEVHEKTDQMFFIVTGEGEALVAAQTRPLRAEHLLFVPAGTVHNVRNTGSDDLKLLTVYAPAAHQEGVVHPTKADALAAR